MKLNERAEHPQNWSIVLLAMGAGVLFASIASALWLSFLQRDATDWVRHTVEVQNRIGAIGRLVTDAESSQRGYLLTARQAYLDPYREATAQLPASLASLEAAIRDNPRQRAAMRALRPAIAARLDELRGTLASIEARNTRAAVETIRGGSGQQSMTQIRVLLDDMASEESRLLARRSATADTRTIIAQTTLILSTILTALLAVLAIRDAQGRVRALEATNRHLRDEVEARRQAQSQVRQLQKMEAVGQLTGGIAHDFNNMLAIVVGSLDLASLRLKRGNGDPAVMAKIDQAMEGARRAAALTAQLLAFSRRQPLEPRIIEPNKLVANISELLRRTLGETIQLETVLAGGLWRIFADPDQVENAIINLAVNARDAMPDGGKLTIETGNTALDEAYAADHEDVAAGQYVMLSVTDTGSGMSAQVLDRVFEPFFTTKGVGRGTGLGLSQVFGFVKQSHGHVKIYSEPGRGSCVKIYLPRQIGEGEPLVPAGAVADMPAGRTGEIILVAEDDELVRMTSIETLENLGYTVIGAANGTEALARIGEARDLTLLFTDIVMPDMTGRVLADRAREIRPDLKILYTTGYTRNAIVHHGVVDYGVAFIQKPFTLDALARKIRDALDG